MGALEVIEDVAVEAGWTPATQLILAARFIDSLGKAAEMHDFLERQMVEEAEMSPTEDEEDDEE